MSVTLNQSSLTRLSDGIISFIQYLFSKAELTPGDYRWNADERATKIFISGPFTFSRTKVGSMPTVTVIRGPFTYENRTIDNYKGADANVFTNQERLEILSGPLTIVCECGAGDECSSLAQYILLELQANRTKMKEHMTFLHRLLWTGITPEQPVKEEAEIVRWQCSITLQASIYTGWINREVGLTRFNSAVIKNGENQYDSIYGSTTQGSDLFVDMSANFGLLVTNKPQFLQSELEKKWYYVSFDGAKMYTVEEIVDSKTLRLSYDNVPYSAPETQTYIKYSIYWNTVHLGVELIKKK